MNNTSSAVDAYIAAAADFAQPILNQLRQVFHQACPEIQETIKWGFPHFEHQGIVGSMAAFKGHVSFGFWKGQQLADPAGLLQGVGKTRMSALKVKTLAELPDEKLLVEYVQEAVELNEAAGAVPSSGARRQKKPKADLEVPPYFLAALQENQQALTTFEGFSYTNRKEYVEWVSEAKREATRQKRLRTAVEWLAEGKPRNWKYMK